MLLAAVALGLSGCGATPTNVAGKVTVNGQPMAVGTIAFVPTAPPAVKVGGQIRDGAYDIPAARGIAPGAYRVEIRWDKPTGKKIKSQESGEEQPEYAEGLPPKFHAQSELTAELKRGPNQVDFDLKP